MAQSWHRPQFHCWAQITPGKVVFVAESRMRDFDRRNDSCESVVLSNEFAYMHCKPDQIGLTIEDNGRGFEVGKRSIGSLGLGIMRERAESINATLNIESRPGEFTAVTVIWRDDEKIDCGPVAADR
jgi:two-component sensor histidine kinase